MESNPESNEISRLERLLAKVRQLKEAAMYAGDFMKAAMYKERESRLRSLLSKLRYRHGARKSKVPPRPDDEIIEWFAERVVELEERVAQLEAKLNDLTQE